MLTAAEYYDQITAQDITAIAKLLLPGCITIDTVDRLSCNCPRHASASKQSLHVSKTTQMWYCFGCGIGGDVLQLVEFVQSGVVTKAVDGKMPPTHRAARDWLAAQIGLEPLGALGRTDEERARIETSRAERDAVFAVLTDLAAYYHDALFSPEHAPVLEWVRKQWGITDDTLHALRIGYSDPNGKPIAWLIERNHDPATIAHTGAFSVTGQDGLLPFFKARLIFPYWERGAVRFLIGRRTPWSEASPYEHAKYKKLPVHAPGGKHACISKHIKNVLFNEDVLFGSPPPPYITITEGVTDCIALMQAGIPALSPVTVHFKDGELEPLADRLRNVPVYLAMDNELSGIGFEAALATARTLVGRGVEARVVVIPLSEAQTNARTALHERFGIKPGDEPAERKRLLDGRTDAEKAEADTLSETAKQDVASWFTAGGTREDFESLFCAAKSPMQYFIDNAVSAARIGASLSGTVKTLVHEIAHLSAVDQAMYLGLLAAACKKSHPAAGLTTPVLKLQLKAANATLLRERQNDAVQALKDADTGSAGVSPASSSLALSPSSLTRGLVKAALLSSKYATGTEDYCAAAAAWLQHLIEQGAIPYRTADKDPFLYFGSNLYWVDGGDRGRSRQWKSFVLEQTGITPATPGGRVFFDALSSLVFSAGKVRERFSWIHTDLRTHTVWFNLNNADDEILKITPDTIEIQINANNPDGIILVGSPKMLPIRYLPEVTFDEAADLFAERICDVLTTDDDGHLLISQWIRTFLLIDFAGTRPMTRFEGRAGSGKTTAAKLISTLIYGEPQQKTGTNAANFSDGARNPVIFLDNIETRQQDDNMINFLLTAITGISKEKRRAGTESDTISERTNCLINTTGIEPLGGELGEVLSRTFTLHFDLPPTINTFIEGEAIGALQRDRNIILSGIFKATQRALCEMHHHNALSKIMQQLTNALPGHAKSRCNDYIALMYLTAAVCESDQPPAPGATILPGTIHPDFIRLIATLNATSAELARGCNQVAAVLQYLFDAYALADEIDGKEGVQSSQLSRINLFLQEYHIRFESTVKTQPLAAGQLFTALRVAARKSSAEFPYKSAETLSARLRSDDETLRNAGFEIITEKNRSRNQNLYTIRLLHPPDSPFIRRDRNEERPF